MGLVVLVPASVWRDATERGWTWGYLNLRQSLSEGIIAISAVWDRAETGYPVDSKLLRTNITYHENQTTQAGVWYRVDRELNELHDATSRRVDSAISLDTFKTFVKQGWVIPPIGDPLLVVAYSDNGGLQPGVSVWQVDRNGAAPMRFSIVEDEAQPLDFVRNEWSVEFLAQRRVTLIGVGSIGSTAADVLAAAGVGRLSLVDDDRLEQRNLARHRLGPADLGRLKVRAMAYYLEARYPSVEIDCLPLDVTTGADVLRPVFAESDLIMCASDGVASRRVVNHLARRARRPAVLAAVLEDGAFGEVIRVHPRTGCLLCLRLEQIDSGTLDPEPGLDLGYGTGTAHRPMTAAPSDLSALGAFAAKVAISTLLTGKHWHQRLPGDYALIGLQPTPDMPPPFDISCSGDVRWHDLPAPRPDCPTCALA